MTKLLKFEKCANFFDTKGRVVMDFKSKMAASSISRNRISSFHSSIVFTAQVSDALCRLRRVKKAIKDSRRFISKVQKSSIKQGPTIYNTP